MPRLKVIEPNQAKGKTAELYDALTKKLGKVINIFKGMGNSAAGLNAYMTLSGSLAEGELTATEQEVIALVTAEINECHYCLAAHTQIAAMANIDADEAINIRKGQPTDAKHKALADFSKAVIETKGYVSDSQLQAIRDAGYTDGQIVEILATLALNFYTNIFNHVNETELDFPEAPAI